MGVRFFLGAHGAYGVMAALESVEFPEAVRIRLGTKLFFLFQFDFEGDFLSFAEDF